MAKEKVEAEGQETTPDPPEVKPEPKTSAKAFSQEEVNRIVAERLEREKKAMEPVLAAAQKWQEHEDGQKSEMEKLQERLAQEQGQRLEAQNRLQAMTVRTAVMGEAAKLNVIDPDAAYRLMDISAIRVNESGEVLGAGEAMAALVQAKPYLIRPQGPPPGATANPATTPVAPATTSPGAPTANAPAQSKGKEIWARISGAGQSDRLWDAATLKLQGGGVFFPQPIEAEEGGPAKP